jgi:type III pantothenate kinase
MEIPPILACDIGNSRVALAVVQGDDVKELRRLGKAELSGLGEAMKHLWENGRCQHIVASSVNPTHLAAVEAAAAAMGERVLLVGRDIPLPIETDLGQPARIGADRLCCAAMAFQRLGRSCVVASFGTAITIDAVGEDGRFLGGSILPGLRTQVESLAEHTALLPRVELTNPDWVFGGDTAQAIVGGVVFGARGAMREITERYATELGHWPLVIITGGDAELVTAGYEFAQAIVPELCLLGVALAFYISHPAEEP